MARSITGKQGNIYGPKISHPRRHRYPLYGSRRDRIVKLIRAAGYHGEIGEIMRKVGTKYQYLFELTDEKTHGHLQVDKRTGVVKVLWVQPLKDNN